MSRVGFRVTYRPWAAAAPARAERSMTDRFDLFGVGAAQEFRGRVEGLQVLSKSVPWTMRP
jgi:hypothetical protein